MRNYFIFLNHIKLKTKFQLYNLTFFNVSGIYMARVLVTVENISFNAGRPD